MKDYPIIQEQAARACGDRPLGQHGPAHAAGPPRACGDRQALAIDRDERDFVGCPAHAGIGLVRLTLGTALWWLPACGDRPIGRKRLPTRFTAASRALG